MWTNFYSAGGWGMHPVSLFGLLLLASAVLCALRPERRFVPILASFGVATLGAGLLGTSAGIVTTLHYLHQVPLEKQLAIGAAGVAESLHNLVLALMIIVLAALIAAIGALRAARAASTGAAE